MMQSDSIAKLAPALVAAQNDIRAVAKSATNPHFKSKYAPLDAIIGMVRPALSQHGLAVTQGATPTDDGKALLVETRLLHASGEWLASVVYIPLAKADPQGAGAAVTYGRRFGLSLLLSIPTDDDDDGNAASRPARQAPKREPAPPRVENPTMEEPIADVDRKMGGKRLGDYESWELQTVITKRRGDPKFAALVAACSRILADRALGMTEDEAVERAKAAVVAETDRLPF